MDESVRSWIDEVLDGAACWGAELDTQYRVLGVTVEPAAGSHPDEAPDDPRLQLVLHPCSEFEGQLVRDGDTVEQFTVDQLVAVVDRFDGAPLTAPVVTAPASPLMGERSLRGEAGPMVVDGRTHEARFELASEDRELVLRVTYDVAELRRPDGTVVAPPTQA